MVTNMKKIEEYNKDLKMKIHPVLKAHKELGKHSWWQNALKNRLNQIAQRIKKVAKQIQSSRQCGEKELV